MRRFSHLHMILLLWLLVSCMDASAYAIPTTKSEAPTAMSTVTASTIPDPTETFISHPATETSAPPTPEPTGLPRQCSLLAGYVLEEFPAIISHPFELPRPGEDDGHHGVDFAHYLYGDKTSIAGASVQAFLTGTVAAAIADSWPYGNFVMIETPYRLIPPVFLQRYPVPDSYALYHLYAHLEAPPELSIGEEVFCGQILGVVGNTGWSGNYHLHFEVRFGPQGQKFNSMAYYQTTTTEEQRLNYEFWRMSQTFILVNPMELLLLYP